MNILRLIAQLSLDGSKFKAGLKESQSMAKGWSKEMSSSIKGELAAVFGAGALLNYAKNTLAQVAALKDEAEQAQVTTAEYQRLGIAAEEAGLKEGDWMQAQQRFNNTRKEAVESSQALRDTFAKYGMTLDDLQNPQLKFIDFIAKANTALENMTPEQKARASAELFEMLGKVGPKLQGFFKELEKHKDDKIVGDESIANVEKADKAIAKLGRTLKILFADNINNPLIFPITGDEVSRLANLSNKINPKGDQEWEGSAGHQSASDAQAKLYKDGIAEEARIAFEKQMQEIMESRLSLEKAIFKVNLDQMSVSDQRAAKEQKLAEYLSNVAVMEGEGEDASREREKAVGVLADLLNDTETTTQNERRTGQLDTNPLTAQGQLGGGRREIYAEASPVVREIQKLLQPTIAMKTAMEALNIKIKGTTTLRGST